MSSYRPGWIRRDPRRLHAVQHLLPPELWYAATTSPAAGVLDRLTAQALGSEAAYRRRMFVSGRRAGKSAAAAHPEVLERLHFTEWTPPPKPEPISREDMLAKLDTARELLASTGYSLEPWQHRVLAHYLVDHDGKVHAMPRATELARNHWHVGLLGRTYCHPLPGEEVCRYARPHQDAPPCSTCGHGGWYGSRWHDPAHHAPHHHCDCGRPCRACAAGDGFHRSSPHTTRTS